MPCLGCSGLSSFEVVVISLLFVCVVAHLGYTARSLSARGPRCWKSSCRRLLSMVANGRNFELERTVAEKVDVGRLLFARGTVTVLSVVLSLGAIAIFFSVFRGGQRAMQKQQDIVFTIASGTVCLVRIRPNLLNLRTLPLWYGLCMLLSAFLLSPTTNGDREAILAFHAHGQVLVLVFSIGHFCFKGTLFWNFVYDMVQGICYARAAGGEKLLIASSAEFWQQTIFIFVEKMAAAWVLEKLVVACVRREVEESARERSTRVAFNSLLGIVCDAVVELDCGHRIVRHVPALAHTLLHGTGRSLEGCLLQDPAGC